MLGRVRDSVRELRSARQENEHATFARLLNVPLGNLIKVRELWMTDEGGPIGEPGVRPVWLWTAFAAVNVVTMLVVVCGQSATGGGTDVGNWTSGR